ncbi:putative porin [Xenophilus arseniciresistens]|uniref:Porin n=1 Tax=Xenophilus arseniciresistens TaxID=1283306 RepID=A0AAE3SXZ3_9BURK|nr:putative porin [Xenophilus arseniciresistens]MDA7414995.1 putative porin [Xenophilus arseniciresistens]
MHNTSRLELRARPTRFVRTAQAMAVATTLALTALTAAAQAPAAAGTAAAAPGESAMVRLIRGLIQSGALARDVGEALLAQAQTEALAAQQAQRQLAVAAAAAPAAGGLRPAAGDVRVPYIPQTVRDQIRDEIKGEVMAQAKTEGWASPNEVAEWTKRIRFEGDLRVRHESRLFGGGNSNTINDFQAINEGSGLDVNPNTSSSFGPLLNTRQDRKNLWRARARIGLVADLSESTQAGVRLASGSDDSPVSTTQTLGGGLRKKDIWLDQAWLSYKPTDWLKLTGGRFANPFVSTDMLFSNDLSFDGVAAQFDKTLSSNKDLQLFGTLGVIPLEYSSDSFPRTSQDKAASENKWLFGVQAGANWKLNDNNRLRGALAYYNFNNIRGERSSPCALYAGADHCDTDWSRPSFMQKGNTLMMLRDIQLNPADPANTPQPQYLGLASKFQLLDLNARWDTKIAGRYDLRLDANVVRNLGYDEGEMFRRAGGGIVNNWRVNAPLLPTQADFRSGGSAYMLQATLGKPSPSARGDWNVLAGYKYIQPDALPDGYNDSSFHLGGTNARGYYIGGSYAIDKNLWFTGRWSATREVYGAPLQIDTLQLELNARF